MAGFIKLDRELMNSFVFKNDRNWWMWCKLKYLEAFEDGEVRLGKSRTKIAFKKGQIAILLKDLCNELKITHKPLRDFLNDLAEEGMISLDIQPKHTIITFIYDNENSNQNAPKMGRKKETGKSKLQPTHIIEEVEEIEEEKNIINSSSTTTREEEIEFLKIMEEDAPYFESMAALHQIEIDVLKFLFQHFKKYCLDRKPHRDFDDCKNHFQSWLVSKYAKNLINNYGTRQRKTQDRLSDRRAGDVTTQSADAIRASFSRRTTRKGDS